MKKRGTDSSSPTLDNALNLIMVSIVTPTVTIAKIQKIIFLVFLVMTAKYKCILV